MFLVFVAVANMIIQADEFCFSTTTMAKTAHGLLFWFELQSGKEDLHNGELL